jgi:ACS family hexuronate transporter-like MFS transporter
MGVTDATVATAKPGGRYRWRVCAMLLVATTINYIDRQVLGVLAPFLQDEIGWNEIQYGYIVTAFQGAYAIGLLCAGAIIDRLGTRIGYAIAIAIWSLAAMGHALAATVGGFMLARFFLGLGEAGNFPAAIKTVAEWFPRRERAFATGIFNSGSNIGAIAAPLMVPAVALAWGWQAAFLVTGVLSAAWLTTWLLWYRAPEQQPRVSSEELQWIRSDPPEATVRVPWSRIIRHRQAWAFVAAKFMTDPIWWFFLFWLPKFLHSEYGLTLTGLGLPLIVIFVMADIGSIAGGWLAGRFVRLGWSLNRARKGAMLVCALCVVPIVFAARADNLWLAVALIGLATAGHQGWSANVFTLTSDMFPRHAVGSVVGMGGFAGAVGGMMIATFIGFLLQSTGSYLPVFLMASSAYLSALLVVHLLAPRLEPALLEPASPGVAQPPGA